MVIAPMGRPFLRKHNGEKVDRQFGPLGTGGERLSKFVCNGTFKDVGNAFFRTENMTLNALRDVQNTVAAEHLIEIGYNHTCVATKELSSRQQTTSFEVTHLLS